MSSGALDRVAVGVLEGIGRRFWGFPPRLMPFVVEALGPGRSLAWFAASMPRYERTLRVLGPLRTHLACVAVSLVNGCRYCAHGHARAVELIHLRDTGRLFPEDAATVAGWAGRPPDEVRHLLCGALYRAGLQIETLWVDRTLALVAGAHPIDREEARIAHVVEMFAVLNAVGVVSRAAPDGAHDPVDKDVAVKARYARLRRVAQ